MSKKNLETIKLLCTAFSKENAIKYKMIRGGSATENNKLSKEIEFILSKKNDILKLGISYGIGGSHGPVFSGTEVNGERINFCAFVQTFEIEAPKLHKLANDIGRIFEIQILRKNNKTHLKVISPPQKDVSDTFIRAYYSISGEEYYAIDMKSGKLYSLTGREIGGAGPVEDGWVLDIDVESLISLDVLIHEIVHAKLPEDIQQYAHENIELISNEITKNLVEYGYDINLNDQYLNEERIKALMTFQKFNDDLKKIVDWKKM